MGDRLGIPGAVDFLTFGLYNFEIRIYFANSSCNFFLTKRFKKRVYNPYDNTFLRLSKYFYFQIKQQITQLLDRSILNKFKISLFSCQTGHYITDMTEI